MNHEGSGAALVRKCRETITEYDMLRVGDHLVVGVSGGADSVALLYVLHTLRREGPWEFSLAAAHLNHSLRGEESDRDEYFVRDLCRWLDIPLSVQWRPVARLAQERAQSVELCAREERYAFFRELGGKTATAHTLDDSAETVLLNLARGTGLRGLAGIPPVRGSAAGAEVIIRPLIACTRAEVEGYCEENRLGFVTDSTNLSDDYARNRLRHRVMPVLREVNPAFPQGLAGMLGSLRCDADYLDDLAARALGEVALGAQRLDARRLAALEEPIRRRVLLRLLNERGITVERRRVEQVERLLHSGGALSLSGEWTCRCARGILEFCAASTAPEPPPAPVVLHAPLQSVEIPVFSDKTLVLTVHERTNFEENINNLPNAFKNLLDCDKMGKIVTIRLRMPGDQIRLPGRGCTKTMKKLFQEAGVPARQRLRTLVLAGVEGPLWVEGFGAGEGAQAGPETTRLLEVAVRGV